MNTKSLSAIAVLVSLILGVMFFSLSCKKDDAGPTAPGGNNPIIYGSGTITTASTVGALNFTGRGAWPIQADTTVMAVYDTAHVGIFLVMGYHRLPLPGYFNAVGFAVYIPGGIAVGTYSHPALDFHAMYNADTLNAEAESYHCEDGTVTVSGVSGTTAWGTYSMVARRGTGQPIQFTGTFNVTFVVGTIPESRSVRRGQLWPSSL